MDAVSATCTTWDSGRSASFHECVSRFHHCFRSFTVGSDVGKGWSGCPLTTPTGRPPRGWWAIRRMPCLAENL